MFSSTLNWLTPRLGWIHPFFQLIVGFAVFIRILNRFSVETKKPKVSAEPPRPSTGPKPSPAPSKVTGIDASK
jgi:hypothetical protein